MISWGLGFLAYIPIPILNVIIAGIAMVLPYRTQRHLGPVAEGNARNAANWGLTLILVVVVGWLLAMLLGFLSNDIDPLAPIAIALFMITLFGSGIVHLVLIIRGLIVAGRNQVARVPFAIPFIRAAG